MRIFAFQVAAIVLTFFSLNIKSNIEECISCSENQISPKEEVIIQQIIDEKVEAFKEEKLRELELVKQEQEELMRKLYALENDVYIFNEPQKTNIVLWY